MVQTQTQSSTLKVLAFPLGNLYLGLRLELVQKIIPTPEIFRSGQKPLGIAHFDNQEVIILDPYQKLYRCPNPHEASYMVIIQNARQDLYGIPLTTVPTLRELPLSTLRLLPPAYRKGDTLGIASHVALVPDGERTWTIFVLDPDCLYSAVADPTVSL
jgi:purine-binding chemotaxis protein CheW